MEWAGFCGAAYRLPSPNVACDQSINLQLAPLEQGPRAGQLRMKNIPGLKDYKAVGTGPIRGMWSNELDLFVASGSQLWQVYKDATPNKLEGNIGTDAHPVFINSNGFQLAISSAGSLYIAPGGVDPVIPVVDTAGVPVNALSVAFQDQYFIAAIIDSKELLVSNLAPAGGTWDPGNAAIKEAYSDNIARVWVDQPGGEYVVIFGRETLEYWSDTAGPFPFSRIQGQVYSIGCDSTWSVAGSNGQRFWYWRGVVWGATGFPPVRISDYGIESAIATYSSYDKNNCEGMCWIDAGHTFYSLSFPEAGITWVYDSSIKAWHRRAFFSNGVYSRYKPRVYANFDNKILCGQYDGNMIYEMDHKTYTDAGGTLLRRERVAPWLTNEENNARVNRFTLDMDTGIGLDVAPDQPGYDPQVIMKYSKDRGKTWSNERQQSAGKIGETQKRVFWKQMGAARIGLTASVVMTDPVPWNINGAYLQIGAGTFPAKA